MKFKIGEIAKFLSGALEGDPEQEVHNIADIEHAQTGDLTFLSNPKYEKHLYDTSASVVIVAHSLELKRPVQAALIRVKDPYHSFTQLLTMVEQTMYPQKVGIEQPSFVSDEVNLGSDLYVGAFAYIGKGAVIGDHVKIYPNCYIGDQVVIGDHTVVYPGASIHHGVKVGAHCVIHHGAVIGADGFGFAPQTDGSYRRIPQLGTVILEDRVSVGANTTIDRATFDATVIKEGVKLDNLVHVAHNCSIGKDTVMAAQVGVAGTAKIGERCMIGGQVGVSGHIEIADETKIVPQSGIMSSITEQGRSWMGAPAVDSKEFFRMTAALRKLPELIKQVRDLEKKLGENQAR